MPGIKLGTSGLEVLGGFKPVPVQSTRTLSRVDWKGVSGGWGDRMRPELGLRRESEVEHGATLCGEEAKEEGGVGGLAQCLENLEEQSRRKPGGTEGPGQQVSGGCSQGSGHKLEGPVPGHCCV